MDRPFLIPLAQMGQGPKPGTTTTAAPTTTQPATPVATAPANAATASAPAGGAPVGSAPAAPDQKAVTIAAPTDFKAEAGPGGVTLTWKDADPNIEGFHIYRSDDGKKTFSSQPVTKAKSETSFTDTQVGPDHTYSYKIVAYSNGKESDPLSGDAATPPTSFFAQYGTIIMAVVLFGGLYFFLFRGQRKEKKKRESIMKELKKGDKVMTIGGMVARVVSVDGDDVVLKIDESNNTKATYRKSAIQEVIDRDDKK